LCHAWIDLQLSMVCKITVFTIQSPQSEQNGKVIYMETQSRIQLGAGMVKTIEDVRRVLELPISEVIIGSITLPKKDGNPEPTFYADGAGNYWNSIGLKNGGEEYYRRNLGTMVKMIRDANREVVVSISGDSSHDNDKLVRLISECAGLDTSTELNIACPNQVTESGGRMPLIGYAPELVRDYIATFTHPIRARRSVRIKVPPYFERELLVAVAHVIAEMSRSVWITHVVATNTMAQCLPLDEEGRPRISVEYAGGSGEQLHSLAVGNVKLWRQWLPKEIEVTGVGGVREARHVRNFERVGASGCQMAGAYWHEGPKALHDVLGGL
jgi:dihydroorotate dehydrogenase